MDISRPWRTCGGGPCEFGPGDHPNGCRRKGSPWPCPVGKKLDRGQQSSARPHSPLLSVTAAKTVRMAVAMLLDFPKATLDQYDRVLSRLDLKGKTYKGGLFHVCGE